MQIDRYNNNDNKKNRDFRVNRSSSNHSKSYSFQEQDELYKASDKVAQKSFNIVTKKTPKNETGNTASRSSYPNRPKIIIKPLQNRDKVRKNDEINKEYDNYLEKTKQNNTNNYPKILPRDVFPDNDKIKN